MFEIASDLDENAHIDAMGGGTGGAGGSTCPSSFRVRGHAMQNSPIISAYKMCSAAIYEVIVM